jgi:tetratricopeptide (TPR) repeat protein
MRARVRRTILLIASGVVVAGVAHAGATPSDSSAAIGQAGPSRAERRTQAKELAGKAKLSVHSGDWLKARELARKALGLAPDSDDISNLLDDIQKKCEELAQEFTKAGRIYVSVGDLHGAEEACGKAILYQEQGSHHEKCREILDVVVEKHLDSARAHMGLKDWTAARRSLLAVKRWRPSDSGVEARLKIVVEQCTVAAREHYLNAKNYFSTGRLDDAIAECRKVQTFLEHPQDNLYQECQKLYAAAKAKMEGRLGRD